MASSGGHNYKGTEVIVGADSAKSKSKQTMASNTDRPVAQGQSARPRTQTTRRSQPAWLASALERTEQVQIPSHKLAGQRQGANDTRPQPGRLFEQSNTVSLTDLSANLSASIERNHGEMMAAMERNKAHTKEIQEYMDRRMTDLSSIVYGLASADHQHQSSPIHREPDTVYQTLAPSSASQRPVPAPRRRPCEIPVVDLPRRARACKPLGDLPKFDGSGDLTVFKLLFAECVELNGWEDEKIITLWLKQCLIGAAKECILYEQVSDSRTVFEKLENRYGNHLLVQKYTVLLDSRKKGQHESISDLANDIRKMVEVVYHDCDKFTREKITISNFIRSLPSVHIKYELNRECPKTLEEAVQRAAIHDVWYGHDSPFRRNQSKISQPPRSSPVVALSTIEQKNVSPPIPTAGTQPRITRPCKHCGAAHMPYVCQPCRHCGGPHFDNKCDRQGNGSPIPGQSIRQ